MAESNGMNWQSIGESALTGGAGAVAGGILGLIGARVQRKQQEKLMAKQFQYQQKAFEMENARQDWLMQNSQSIAKAALQQAGYSTADPNGTGVTPGATGTLDSPTQSAPSADIGASAVSGMRAASDLKLANAQADLMESQKNLYDKQAGRYDEYTDAQIAEIRQRANEEESRSELNFQQAESIRTMLPILKDKGNAEVEKIRNEAAVFKKQEEKLAKDIEKIIQDIKVGKSQEALNYASAEEARTRADLNRQLQSESDAREGLTRQQQETERENTYLKHEEAELARYNAIWKNLEIVARQNGFDINDSQAKQQYTHMCWKLVNAKDENDVKRILKHSIGNLGYACDWLLQQAGGLITGVAVGSLAARGKGSKKAEAPAPSYDTKPPSPDPSVWY